MSYQTWRPESLPPSALEHWFYSIKLDGAFARWTGAELLTKSGRILHPPPRLTATLPTNVALDGEIYHPRRNLVRKAILADEWDDQVDFVVFDLFDTSQPFEQRWQRLQHLHRDQPFKMVRQYRFSAQHWPELAEQIRQQQEEGLVLRDPQVNIHRANGPAPPSNGNPCPRAKLASKPWLPKNSGLV